MSAEEEITLGTWVTITDLSGVHMTGSVDRVVSRRT